LPLNLTLTGGFGRRLLAGGDIPNFGHAFSELPLLPNTWQVLLEFRSLTLGSIADEKYR